MKRTKAEQVKRYLIFLVGLFVNSLGVSLITKGNLGTSPISSIPYVLSLNFPFSLGNFTIVFSLLLIFLQFLLLGKNFKAEHLLQIPVSMAFGYFIDMSMILLGFVHPVSYISKVLGLLIGCLVLFVNSLGVSLITKGNLGTSPISSIPYVLSLNFPFSLGNFTIVFSLLLIFLQFLLLGKNFKAEHLLQIPVSMAFGYFIDMSMILLGFVHPVSYISKVLGLLIGCLVLGVGVYMEVLADVVMLPGESFVRAVVFRIHSEFGFTKVCFDVSMAVIAAVLSFLLSGHLEGVREGTIVAAVLVGFIARSIGKRLSFLPVLIYGDDKKEEEKIEEELNDIV